jgi:RNA polymerase sigma-70 factor, ECF subfamily
VVTERRPSGNQVGMQAVARLDAPPTAEPMRPLDFEQVYETYFDFVALTLRRLGVSPQTLDDALQEVFIVVHRRLGEFEGRSTLKTWLTRVALNVAADHRRLVQRKGGHEELPDTLADVSTRDPHQSAEHAEAIARLYRTLEKLDIDHRTVFVLVELEQMTAPEIAEVLGVKLNTVYSRLRVARERFQAALEQLEGSSRE